MQLAVSWPFCFPRRVPGVCGNLSVFVFVTCVLILSVLLKEFVCSVGQYNNHMYYSKMVFNTQAGKVLIPPRLRTKRSSG